MQNRTAIPPVPADERDEIMTEGNIGHPSCPCLPLGALPIDEVDEKSAAEILGPHVNLTSYGLGGCATHDKPTPKCSDDDECAKWASSVVSPAALVKCDRSWCDRSWCFVDPYTCDLMHSRSVSFPHSYDHYYSYATCNDMDRFTRDTRIGSLYDRTFRVGYNANSGGWRGAYADDGVHFNGPRIRWSGPAVEFVDMAMRVGGFEIEMASPPDVLWPKSVNFFDSHSKFDYCVYATALGYLDFCVSQYTITDLRAVSAEFFVLDSQPLYLVIMNEGEKGDAFQEYKDSVRILFEPFATQTWLFIIVIVIPVMGMLVIWHEYGVPGSWYRQTKEVVVVNPRNNSWMIQKRNVPFYKHIPKSIYASMLGVLQQSYQQRIISQGGKIHLLGMAFFILTIIAVYTANLAAILSQPTQRALIDSLDDAIYAGYTFCGDRKNVDSLMNMHQLHGRFIMDPVDEGGDGKPGFNCDRCKSRMRVFDFMDPTKSGDGSGLYCDAAIVQLEDLESLQHERLHCNKTYIGEPIAYVQTGFPVFKGVSTELVSLFLTLKNAGVHQKELLLAKPSSRCPVLVSEGDEGTALSVVDLTGIWTVSYGFAILGLLVSAVLPCLKRKCEHDVLETNRYTYDQYGHRDDKASRLSVFAEETVSHGLGKSTAHARTPVSPTKIEDLDMSSLIAQRDKDYRNKTNPVSAKGSGTPSTRLSSFIKTTERGCLDKTNSMSTMTNSLSTMGTPTPSNTSMEEMKTVPEECHRKNEMGGTPPLGDLARRKKHLIKEANRFFKVELERAESSEPVVKGAISRKRSVSF